MGSDLFVKLEVCLLRALLGLKFRQILFRSVLVLPDVTIFQKKLNLRLRVSYIALLAVDLGKQKVKTRLMMLRVECDRLRNAFLCFRQVVQMEVRECAEIMGISVPHWIHTQELAGQSQQVSPLILAIQETSKKKIGRQIRRIG